MRAGNRQFDRGFLRCLFCSLATLGAQPIREDAETLRDGGTKLVGLNQHRYETSQIVNTSALGEIAQRFITLTTYTDFQVR